MRSVRRLRVAGKGAAAPCFRFGGVDSSRARECVLYPSPARQRRTSTRDAGEKHRVSLGEHWVPPAGWIRWHGRQWSPLWGRWVLVGFIARRELGFVLLTAPQSLLGGRPFRLQVTRDIGFAQRRPGVVRLDDYVRNQAPSLDGTSVGREVAKGRQQ